MFVSIGALLFGYDQDVITNAHISNVTTSGVGIVLFIFAWIPIFVFDRLAYKIWLQFGVIGMMCSTISITILQWHTEHHPGDKANYAIIAFPYLFNVLSNISWGIGSWTYTSEIFRDTYLAKSNALSTMSL